jgi:predicted metal-binding protein
MEIVKDIPNSLSVCAKRLGFGPLLSFHPKVLLPEARIRALCAENKCGNYGKNYTCPPFVGSVSDIRNRLKAYKNGILFQYTEGLDVKQDREGVHRTMLDFHERVLELEAEALNAGLKRVWGMIGGNCQLCQPCRAETDEPCLYPDKARMSLESLAIDVLGLLERFGLDNRFHPHRITWTGCILF